MPRRALCLGSALLLVFAGCSRPPQPAPIDHVLLIVVDTLRADHLSAYGYARETSPTLEALAREGVLFENAISQASWTLPSMVSMMTGSWIAERAMQLPESRVALAEVFQERGFATAAFIYNGLLSRDNRFDRGFDVFDYKAPPYGSNDPIREWISANKDSRSFTFVHLNEAHDPYGSTDDKWPANAPVPFTGEQTGLDPDRLRIYERISADEGLFDDAESKRHIEQQIGAYDDDIAYTDERIRGILDDVRAAGIWERTAIVVASDHGEGLWTRLDFPTGGRLRAIRAGRPTLVNALQMTHGNLGNIELVHVPLILKAPGLKPGRRVSARVENVDIAATLLELCDLKPPAGMNGTSLLGLARGASTRRRGAFTYTIYVTSLVDQNGMHLIHPTALGECQFGLMTELYDLRIDPRERNNIAHRHPELVRHMIAEIDERLPEGIHSGNEQVSFETLADLNALGYIDSGIWDPIQLELQRLATDALLAKLEDPVESAHCVVRLRLVSILSTRELTAAQRARLEALLDSELSENVRREMEKALGVR
jgi:arylsulfatase A-like enzyme